MPTFSTLNTKFLSKGLGSPTSTFETDTRSLLKENNFSPVSNIKPAIDYTLEKVYTELVYLACLEINISFPFHI